MALPATLTVSINFANGPAYGIPFTLDDPAKGILGTNVLADNASLVIDYSTSTTNIAIRRGRNLLQDRKYPHLRRNMNIQKMTD